MEFARKVQTALVEDEIIVLKWKLRGNEPGRRTDRVANSIVFNVSRARVSFSIIIKGDSCHCEQLFYLFILSFLSHYTCDHESSEELTKDGTEMRMISLPGGAMKATWRRKRGTEQ